MDAQNNADAMIAGTEKQLSEHGDKISDEEKKAIEDAIAALKEVKDTDKVEDITTKTQELMQSAMKLGEAAYKAAQERKVRKAQMQKRIPRKR